MKFAVATAFCDLEHYCALARVTEECGYAAIAVSDHVVHPEKIETPYPYTDDGIPRFRHDTPWPDPWVAIGSMAAVTRRLRFLTNVCVVPLRNPFSLAKMVGTASVMSEGRVSLGIGVGWMKEEFDLLGQAFRGRGGRTDEMIEILRKLWTGKMVEHRGPHYAFPRLCMTPAPRQRIPIYVGGTSKRALQRAARLGDGWISELHSTEELSRLIAQLHAERKVCGRTHEPFEIFASATDALGIDGYRRLAAIGVTQVLTQPWLFYGGRTRTLERLEEGLRRFAEDVVTPLA